MLSLFSLVATVHIAAANPACNSVTLQELFILAVYC